MDGGRFTIDDMTRDDLERIEWSGGPLHVEAVREALLRRDRNEVDYLVVRDRDGAPVCKTGVDYAAVAGRGTIWQLATHSEFEGRGLATAIIAAAESRMRGRSLTAARLGVEYDNQRALGLYLHLGYVQVGEEPASWEYLNDDGTRRLYETVCAILEKPLSGVMRPPRAARRWSDGIRSFT